MFNVISKNIFSNLKKKLFLFKVIKLNKLFLKFSPVLYLNQINNVKTIISFIKKMLKGNFLKTNKFIFVLKVFLIWIGEMKLKKRFLKFK